MLTISIPEKRVLNICFIVPITIFIVIIKDTSARSMKYFMFILNISKKAIPCFYVNGNIGKSNPFINISVNILELDFLAVLLGKSYSGFNDSD